MTFEERVRKLEWSCKTYHDMARYVAGVEAENEHLLNEMRRREGEIQSLREALRDGEDNARKMLAESAETIEENEKLRELVYDFLIWEHKDCSACGYRIECRATEKCIAVPRLTLRAKRLGIEVDDA